MYQGDQSFYSSALQFAPHNKEMAHMRRNNDPDGKKSPFAGMGAAFGAEPIGPGHVRFNMYAPPGCRVEVEGMPGTPMWTPGGARIQLRETEEGFYTGEVFDWPCGFQYIQFYVNDIPAMNPKAPIGVGYGKAVNFCEVPGDPEEMEVYALKDVPHGTVTMEIYFSSVTGMYRNCYVYTPPTYDIHKKYPIFFLQHGGGEDETGWLWQGRINYIMDNLLAEGKAREMIIVLNAGYAFRQDESYEFLPGDLGAVLEKDLLPVLEMKYSVYTDREHRAMAGLSMGSWQTQHAAVVHPELFAWEGIFSGGPSKHLAELDMDTNFADLDDARRMRLIFISCGTGEARCQEQIDFVEQMKAEGLDNIVMDTWPGVHEWRVWRHAACEFLKLLFAE